MVRGLKIGESSSLLTSISADYMVAQKRSDPLLCAIVRSLCPLCVALRIRSAGLTSTFARECPVWMDTRMRPQQALRQTQRETVRFVQRRGRTQQHEFAVFQQIALESIRVRKPHVGELAAVDFRLLLVGTVPHLSRSKQNEAERQIGPQSSEPVVLRATMWLHRRSLCKSAGALFPERNVASSLCFLFFFLFLPVHSL